jgi:Transposase DDE domain
LLDQLGRRARALALTDEAVTASVDATGLEDHHASPHFLRRRGQRTSRYQPWLKLALVGDHRSHLLLGAVVARGPSNDSPLLPPAVRQACRRASIRQLLGDGAFDAEPHHRLCRETLNIPHTVFPLNPRGHPKTVRGRYRRQLRLRFPKKLYRQRWQIESMISRLKRRLGCALTARIPDNQEHEALWRVVAYNCLLVA